MHELMEHAEALIVAGVTLVTTFGTTLWRIERLRIAFQNGVVRPVAREEAANALAEHVAKKHA